MKKTNIIIAAIAALGMLSATVSFADALNGAAGKKLAAAVESKAQAKMHMVDVLVVNRSDNTIIVENPPYIRQALGSGDVFRLPSEAYGSVRVQIINTYNNTYTFSQDVCHRAILIVRGRYSNLPNYLDNTDCFKK